MKRSKRPPSKIEEMERQMIVDALNAHQGNLRRAATELRMPKSTLYDRARQYGLTKKQVEVTCP